MFVKLGENTASGQPSGEKSDCLNTVRPLSGSSILAFLDGDLTDAITSPRTPISDTMPGCQNAQLDGSCGSKQITYSDPPAKVEPHPRICKRKMGCFGSSLSSSDEQQPIERKDLDKKDEDRPITEVTPRPSSTSSPSQAVLARKISLSGLNRRTMIARRKSRSASSNREDQVLSVAEFLNVENVPEQDIAKDENVLVAPVDNDAPIPRAYTRNPDTAASPTSESNGDCLLRPRATTLNDIEEPAASAFYTPVGTWSIEGRRTRSCRVVRHVESDE